MQLSSAQPSSLTSEIILRVHSSVSAVESCAQVKFLNLANNLHEFLFLTLPILKESSDLHLRFLFSSIFEFILQLNIRVHSSSSTPQVLH